MNRHSIENCPIRRNVYIRNLLATKFAQYGYLRREVVADARSYGVLLTNEVLSSYMNSFDELTGEPVSAHQLPSLAILQWLCARWGIDLTMVATSVQLTEDQLKERARNFTPTNFIKKKKE